MEAGVRARDARSGSSRDFFLLHRDLCTRVEDGTGLPPLLDGDCVRRVGESKRRNEGWRWLFWLLALAALNVELPML